MPAITATFRADLTQFERSLAQAETKVTGLQRSTSQINRELARFGNDFSGANLIRQANSMAKAVEQIGGVSKLTAAEQRKLSGTVDEALAKYRQLGQEVPPNLVKIAGELTRAKAAQDAAAASAKALADAQAKVAGEAGRSAGAFSAFAGDLVKQSSLLQAVVAGGVAGVVSSLATGALNAASALGKLAIEGIGAVVARGGEIAPVREGFVRLSGGIEQADRSLGVIRASTRGLVSDFDAMQAANKAMLLGVTRSGDELGKLAQTAATLGRAMGQTATKSLDDLITALGRSSPLILDNLGLTVSIEKANIAYAASLGKAANQLTDAEKKQAFMNAALAAAEERVKELGGITLSFADRIQIVRTQFQNFTDALAVGISQAPALNAALEALGVAMVRAFGGNQVALVQAVVEQVNALTIAATSLVGVTLHVAEVGTRAFGAYNVGAAQAAATTVRFLGGLLEGIQQVSSVLSLLPADAGRVWGAVSSGAEAASAGVKRTADDLDALARQLAAMASGTSGLNEGLRTGATTLATLAAEMREAAARGVDAAEVQRALAASTNETAAASGKAADEIRRLVDAATGASAQKEIRQLEAAFGLLTAAQRANADIVRELLKPYEELRQKAGVELSKVLEQAREAFQTPLAGKSLFQSLKTEWVEAEGALKGIPRVITEIGRLKDAVQGVNLSNLLGGLTTSGLLPSFSPFRDLATSIREAEQAVTRLVEQGKRGTDEYFAAVKKLNDEHAKLPTLIDASLLKGQQIAGVAEHFTAVTRATITWQSALKDTSQAFGTLAQIGGEGLQGFARQFGEIVTLMTIAGQAGSQLRELFTVTETNKFGQQRTRFSLDNFRFNQGQGGLSNAQVAGNYVQAAAATAQAGFAVWQATNVRGRGNRIFRGAATGAAEGGQIGGPYGAIGGAIVGALIGAFRNPAFEDVYKRVARNFGVTLSDETAKAIADLAKARFGGNRQAAEIFSLDTIIAEGGGLNSSNIDRLQARLRDAFSMREIGRFTTAELEQVLESNFGAFAAYVERQTTIASRGFSEILQLANRFGATTPEMREFVGGQTGRLGGSLEALAGPLLQQLEALRGAQADLPGLLGERDQLRGESDLSKEQLQRLKELEEQIRRTQSAIDDNGTALESAQVEFDRLGIIAVGSFNAARQAGLGFLEATDQLSPGLDRLIALQQELGLEGNAAFDELLKFRDLVATNETLVASAEGLNEAIVALSNIGGLTAETFAALEGQGLQTFERLTGAGFTSNQALQIMGGFLENLREAHQQLGVPIDENTAALIAQAEAQGILRAEGLDMVSVLRDGLSALIEAVGGELPEAWRAAAASAQQAGQTTAAAVNQADGVVRDHGERVADEIQDAANTGAGAWRQYGDVAEYQLAQAEQLIQEALDASAMEFRRFADQAIQEIGRIPTDIGIDVRFKTPGDFPDIRVPDFETPQAGYNSARIPGLATGGVVLARPGGTVVRVGEAGRDEAIVPLPARLAAPSSGVSVQALVAALSQITFRGEMDGRPVLRFVSRELPGYIQTRTGQRVPV